MPPGAAPSSLLRALLDEAPVGLALLDADLRYLFVNQRLAAMNGVPGPDHIGRTIAETLPELGAPAEEPHRHVLATGERVEGVRIRAATAADPGRLGDYECSFYPVRDGAGAVVGSGVVVVDVTEARATEEQRERLVERLREEAAIIETLYRVSESLVAELDIERVLQAVTDAATSLSAAQFGAFFYPDVAPDGELYRPFVVSGVPRERFGRFPPPRNTPVFAPTFAGEAVVRLDDVTADPRYGELAPYHGMPPGHLPVRSYLAVPVFSRGGEVIGGLFFGHEQPGVFTERAERLVTGIAAHAAIAIDNARLYAGEQRARREAERTASRLSLLQQVTAGLAGARDLRSVATAIIEVSTAVLGAQSAIVCPLDDDGVFSVLTSVRYSEETLRAFASFGVDDPLPAGDAVRTREPVLLRSVAERDERYPRLAGVPAHDEAYAVLPLVADDRVLGVAAFGWGPGHDLSSSDVDILQAIAGQFAQALERARLHEAERVAQERVESGNRRLAFLAEASRVLASSLDLDDTYAAVRQLVVPAVADAMSLHLFEERGLATVAIAHADPEITALLQRVDEAEDHFTAVPRVLEVAQSGVAVLAPEVDAAALAAALPAGPARDTLAGLTIRSGIVVPLESRGRVIGALALWTGRSGRVYGDTDLADAHELARRVAVAVDNARVHQARTSVAVTLQRSLLPRDVPRVEGLEIAARYVPGSAETDVGGDWFDVVALSAGRVAIVIGDVMGRGVRAAAVMGQLRAAVRAYAALDPPPEQVMTHLDALVQGLDEVQIVTCVYAAYDPATGRCSLANAGHVPPLLVTAGGTTELASTGVPLGVGGVAYTAHEFRVSAGDVLLLYTDGLVETPGRSIDDGIGALTGIAAGARTGPLDRIGDEALTALAPQGGFGDDVALLAVRVTSDGAGPVRRLVLPPHAAAAGETRRFVAAELAEPQERDVAALLASELVANAVRHARTPVEVRVQTKPRSVIVEVADGDPRLPRMMPAEPEDEGGRGLHLVDALSDRWGARPVPDGKVVWFVLRRRPAGASATAE